MAGPLTGAIRREPRKGAFRYGTIECSDIVDLFWWGLTAVVAQVLLQVLPKIPIIDMFAGPGAPPVMIGCLSPVRGEG